MSRENRETLGVYEELAGVYLENNVKHDALDPEKAERKQGRLQNLIRESFAELPEGAKVFEIGSADGGNAKFLASLGFVVTASDAANSFLRGLKEAGVPAVKFNALVDEFPEKYDGIFCWRVFVHFNLEDARTALRKIYDGLLPGGVFVFNAWNRQEDEAEEVWVDFPDEYYMGAERYFYYFRPADLEEIIAETGFEVVRAFKEGGKTGEKWLVYVLKKDLK